MSFFFHFLPFIAVMITIIQIGLSTFSNYDALQSYLENEQHNDLQLRKCAQHLANRENAEEAYRFLYSVFPKHREELSRVNQDIRSTIARWQAMLSCEEMNTAPVSPSLRRSDNSHLHPYWPNWVAAFYRATN